MKTTSHIIKIDSFILPTKFGKFKLVGYEISNDTKEKYAIALIKGNLKGKENVLVRIHSQCLFSEVFGSKTCDCREQLEYSLKLINKKGGVIIYLDQEGRGHGIITKIKEYSYKEKGYDTYEASIKVGERPDNRNYKYSIQILKNLGVKSIQLLTNNPEKIQALKLSDVKLIKRIPLEVKSNRYNRNYLKTKKEKFAHLLLNI